jgi:arginase
MDDDRVPLCGRRVRFLEAEVTASETPVKPVHIIGVPLDLGGGRRGVDMGPSALRIAGLAERISALGRRVVDKGDLAVPIPETQRPGDERKRYIRDIAKVCTRVYQSVLTALESGALPLLLGGDHSLAAGSVAASAAFARERGASLGLIWIDAHGDMNTPASTTTGNVHGMPLAALLGPEPAELAAIGGFSPKVDPAHTVLVGVRNLDEREKLRVRESGVHVFTMKDIDRAGVAAVAEQAILLAGQGTAGIHVSFDLDACDPSVAPGVGTPVKGGLDYREAHMVMEVLADSGLLTGLDVVEVNPTLDIQNNTAVLGAELVSSALGMKIL